jgi:hypothetical protein
MKYIKAGLMDSISTTYDQTKTTIQGRIIQKTIGGQQVLGPALNKFIDVIADAGLATVSIFISENGRIFSVGAKTGSYIPCFLHTIDFTTGAVTYVGKIQFAIADTATTTHTYRGLKVLDNGNTGWKIFFATTGSVLINGGLYMVNNIDLTDFVPFGFPTIPFATGNNQKAVYFLQDPAAIGVNQQNTISNGIILDKNQNRVYVHNGTSATHQYYVYDAAATPTYSTSSVTGVAATDVISHAGHTFVDNDPIVFTSITGGAGITVGTVYFVRNSVAGTSYQISTTSGGTPLNFTTDITAGQVGRAFGTTGSNWLFKTGNLPALTGTLLSNNSEDFAVPGHTTNAGQDCAFFATSTNLYLGKLSDLTAGTTTWPSLINSNLLGTPNQIIAPTAAFAAWSTQLDRALYVTQTNIFVLKQVVNNSIDVIFGGNNNKYYESFTNDIVEYQMNSINSLSLEPGGYLATVGPFSVTGQRVIYLTDLRSDAKFNYSFIVTKVLNTPSSVYKFITTLNKYLKSTGTLEVYYRTSGFSSISGGWTLLPLAEDLSTFAAGSQVQFKILFSTLGTGTSIPAQIYEFILGVQDLNEISEHWEYHHTETNPSANQVAYRLKKAYNGSVPNLRHTVRDLSDTLVANHTTSANSSFFQYSTDNGATWTTLGTIPNTVGTLVRYTNNTLPGQELRPALQEA